MADLTARIKPQKSSTTGEVPQASDLEVAEIAVNTADGKLFVKHTDNSIKEISGGGGSSTLDGLTDVNILSAAPTYAQNFENEVYPIDANGIRSTEQAHTGTYSFKGTGPYGSIVFGSVLKSNTKRYDCWSFYLYPTNALDATYRASLGGSRNTIGSGAGYIIYTRDTGFGLYSGGGFTEVGTRPTIAPGQWHHVFVQVDFGTSNGQSRKPQAVSVWIDGAIAVNNVTWTQTFTDYGSTIESYNFAFAESTTGTAHDKYYDDLRICQTDTPITAMTTATITPATIDAAIDAVTVDPIYGMGLIYDGQKWIPGYSDFQIPSDNTIPLNAIQGVNWNGSRLEITNLGSLPFSSVVNPSVTYHGFYDNSTYGMAYASYTVTGSVGTFTYTHESKGFEVKLPDTGIFRISGKADGTSNQPELRFESGNATTSSPNGNYLGFKLPANYTVNQTYTLPLVDGNSGDVLQTDSNGVLSFATPAVTSAATARTLLGIGEYADDTAAGTGGVASGAMYYNTTSSDYRLKS